MGAELSRRERKKLQAMRHIQEVALDLFDADGYANVTIERIAAEAEVSPSSVYRYFGTKERLLLYDEYDPQFIAAFDDALAVHDPVTALRETLSTVFRQLLQEDEELIRRRMRYTMGEPSVRAQMIREMEDMESEIRQILARRTGRDGGDLGVRVVTAAIISAFMAALTYWHETDYEESLDEIVDQTLTMISRGLTLD